MANPELTLSHGTELMMTATQGEPKQAVALFELLKGVIDPNGDPIKYSVGDGVMRQLILLTPQFEEWYKAQLVA